MVVCSRQAFKKTECRMERGQHVDPAAGSLPEKPPAYLHLLIPASHPDVNLCKLLLSAAILGYPTPIIINWNEIFDDTSLVENGSHLAKISGVHEYVSNLTKGHDDDLVVMVDGYDVWMQLRPQTLLERYFDINRQADARLQRELGVNVVQRNAMRQEIVFGCQKKCWPWSHDDPPCYAVPNSTVAPDIRGDLTDTMSDDERNPFVNYRPRFLVSGTAVGTVRAFRRLFGQALEQMKTERNFGSDQYIFSHIFGDQEIWRESLRQDAKASSAPRFHHELLELHRQEVREKASQRLDNSFEFGIGIDYRGELVLNTVFAEDEAEWLVSSSKQQVVKAQNQVNVPTRYRKEDLTETLKDSLPPYWTFSYEPNLPRWMPWSDVPLFTNVVTGIQPAVIHHNAHRDGLKSRRKSRWSKIWFQRYARTLYDAHIYAPVGPVAFGGHHKISKRQYWPAEIWKGGAIDGLNATRAGVRAEEKDPGGRPSNPGGSWIRFEDICQDHEELFRDGKGPWVLPEIH